MKTAPELLGFKGKYILKLSSGLYTVNTSRGYRKVALSDCEVEVVGLYFGKKDVILVLRPTGSSPLVASRSTKVDLREPGLTIEIRAEELESGTVNCSASSKLGLVEEIATFLAKSNEGLEVENKETAKNTHSLADLCKENELSGSFS